MKKKNLLVAQSGGPTAAINATLAGVIRRAMAAEQIDKVYGGLNGIAGITEGRVICLSDQVDTEEDLLMLAATPAMALGSCRLKLQPPQITPDVYSAIERLVDRLNIGYFLYIGGNDSMDTVAKLSDYFASKNRDIKVIGVPKTIDNDLDVTDHTPGFGSAVKYVATSTMEVYRDAIVYGRPSVTVIEIMGRDAGWLTASSALAHTVGCPAPHLMYLPELPFDPDRFLEELEQAVTKHVSVVVAVSEGIRFADGSYVHRSSLSDVVDDFGHQHLSGAGRYLEYLISERIGCRVRVVELSVLQRSAAHFASKADVDEAELVGETAVNFALEGKTGVMAAIIRKQNFPYKAEIEPIDVKLAANQVKHFPLEWFDQKGHTITQEAVDYFLPLIAGESQCYTQNGLPIHFIFDDSVLA